MPDCLLRAFVYFQRSSHIRPDVLFFFFFVFFLACLLSFSLSWFPACLFAFFRSWTLLDSRGSHWVHFSSFWYPLDPLGIPLDLFGLILVPRWYLLGILIWHFEGGLFRPPPSPQISLLWSFNPLTLEPWNPWTLEMSWASLKYVFIAKTCCSNHLT